MNRTIVEYNVEQFEVFSNAAVRSILAKAAQGIMSYLDVVQLFKLTLGQNIPNPRCDDISSDCKLAVIVDNVDAAVSIAMSKAGIIDYNEFSLRVSNSVRDKIYTTWLNVPAVCQ